MANVGRVCASSCVRVCGRISHARACGVADVARRVIDLIRYRSSVRTPRAPRRTVIDKRGQANKGAGWMSWHREATKDAVACDKLREAGKRALIRRFPNEETQLHDLQLLSPERIG